MLVRGNPFREWIAVYYDPARITEEKLVELLRKRRCPSARLDRAGEGPLTVMNPSVGPGDVVQMCLAAEKNPGIDKVTFPDDWKLVGGPGGFSDPDGVTWFTVKVAAEEKQGKHEVVLHPREGDPLKASIEVVRKHGP
jgi:hypothetical protein